VVPNVGVNAAASDVAVTGAEPLRYPVLVVVIVAVALHPAATPATVTNPLPLIEIPGAVAVQAHV